MEVLQEDVQAIHEEHRALWDSLDPEGPTIRLAIVFLPARGDKIHG